MTTPITTNLPPGGARVNPPAGAGANDGVRWEPPADWRIPPLPAIQILVTRAERFPVARCERCDRVLGTEAGRLCQRCEERASRRRARRLEIAV